MAETKWTNHYSTLSITGSPGGVVSSNLAWTPPLQGVTKNTRIGNRIRTKRLTFRFSTNIDPISVANGLFSFRVFLFTWKGGKSIANPGYSDLIDGATTSGGAFVGPFNSANITVLKSWRFTMSTIGTTTSFDFGDRKWVIGEFSKPFVRDMIWNQAGTPVFNSPDKEPYVGILSGFSSSVTMTFNYSTRVSFVDI